MGIVFAGILHKFRNAFDISVDINARRWQLWLEAQYASAHSSQILYCQYRGPASLRHTMHLEYKVIELH